MSLPASPFALFDDNLGEGGDLLLHGACDTLECREPARVSAFFAAIEAARARGCWIALAAHYELGHALEARLLPLLPQGCVLARAWIFSRAELLTPQTTRELLAPHAGSTPATGFTAHQSPARHAAAVQRIRDYIAAGDCYQVNYTFPFSGALPGDPVAHYAALRERQPVAYGALLLHADGAILSRSPELFVERRGDCLTARPMKGTAPLEAGPQALAESDKNRAENLMITDLIRNDLGRLAPAGGVRVPALFSVERYASLWQMTSTVQAQPVQASLETVFRALFPCGSVTGAPKLRAMQIIHELEDGPRGLYCGALGWIAPWGDFRFSVPIRTLERTPDGHARGGLGSGIVLDSDPADEWAECLLKGRFAGGAAPAPVGLIETLRRDADDTEPCPDLALHLARLTASAACFGYPLDPQAARRRILQAAQQQPAPGRIRLQLDADGSLQLSTAPLEALAGPVRTAFATPRLDSRDPLLRHKTTARARYDLALQQAMAAGLFDLIFLNERGEVCEGARSNVFIRRAGRLLTPPLACGCLDGVLRRRLLASGEAREARLTPADLQAAEALYLGNALRGLLPAQLSAPAPG